MKNIIYAISISLVGLASEARVDNKVDFPSVLPYTNCAQGSLMSGYTFPGGNPCAGIASKQGSGKIDFGGEQGKKNPVLQITQPEIPDTQFKVADVPYTPNVIPAARRTPASLGNNANSPDNLQIADVESINAGGPPSPGKLQQAEIKDYSTSQESSDNSTNPGDDSNDAQ